MTGLTSNPTIFDHAIKNSSTYDAAIAAKLEAGKAGEALFFDLAIEDLTRAADLFRPIHERTEGVDGWVSLEVSPLLAYDTREHASLRQGPARARRPAEPVHQDSRHQRRAPRDRGSDLRRHPDQRDAAVLPRAVRGRGRCLHARHRTAHRRRASIPTSARSPRCSSAVGTSRSRTRSRRHCSNRLGIAVAQRTYKAYRDLLGIAALAARLQRGRAAAAAAVGEHRDEGSQGLRRALHRGARRAAHRQHNARGDAEGASPTTARSARCCRRTAATVKQVLAQFAKAGVDVDALGAAAAGRRRRVVRASRGTI